MQGCVGIFRIFLWCARKKALRSMVFYFRGRVFALTIALSSNTNDFVMAKGIHFWSLRTYGFTDHPPAFCAHLALWDTLNPSHTLEIEFLCGADGDE